MKPVKGQNRDRDFITNIPDTISDGKNFIITDLFSTITSEKGNIILHSVTGFINGIISTSDSIVIFSIDGEFSEIGIYKDDKYTIILKTKYLSFDINHPISGEYYYNENKELIIFFYDDINTSKIININSLPFEIDTNYELYDSKKIKLLEQFIPFKQPIYKLIGVYDNDGNLPQGVYYVSIQYRLIDGTYTNSTDLSNPIFVVKESSGEEWENYAAYYENINTNKSINLAIDNIDNLFLQYRVNIIYKSYTETLAYVSDDYNIDSLAKITISSLDKYKQVNISDILIRSMSFLHIGTSTAIDNRLYIANLTTNNLIKYQKYANNITIDWVFNNQVSMDGIKGSYKDSVVIFNSRGFMPGEIYAFYIRFINTNNNKTSQVFHIAGRNPDTGETDLSTNVDALAIYPNAKKFQIENTCSIIDSTNGIGKMGYWENEDELYPNADLDKDGDFDGSIDYNGIAITNGRNLHGTPVKHHKFPTLNYLVNSLSNKKIISDLEDVANGSYIRFYNPITVYNDIDTRTEAIANFEIASFIGTTYNNKWINTTKNSLSLTINYDLSVNASTFNVPEDETTSTTTCTIYLRLNIYKINTDGTTTLIIGNDNSTSEVNTVELKGIINEVINANEGIYIDGYGNCSNGLVANFGGSVYCGFGLTSEVEGSIFGRILGIKLSNIHIPDYIKTEYDSFEILYSERNTSNMSVLGSSILPNNTDINGNYVYNKFYNFDLLNSKLSLNPSHIIFDYIYEDGTDNTSTKTVIDKDINIIPISNYIYPIKKAKYILNNISYSNPSNKYGGEHIYLEYKDTKVPLGITDSTIYQYLMGTLYSFKSSVYKNFSKTTLVRTGMIINIDDTIDSNNNCNTDTIYGGDTFLSLHGITAFGDAKNPLAKDFKVIYYLIPEYGIANIGLRYKDNKVYNIFYPKYNLINNINAKGNVFIGDVNTADISGNNYIGASTSQYDSLFTSIVKALDQYKNIDFRPYNITEYYGYNKLWNSLNDLQPFIVFDINNNFIDKFPYTIYRTLPISTENNKINWRTILPNEYVTSVSDRKEIVNLDNNGKDLLVEHRYGLFVYQFVNQLNIDNNVVSGLGDSDIFNRKSLEAIPNGKGYVGCQSKFASIKTKFGNIIIDREQGKIFIYNDTIDEISRYGMRKFFINNLQYTNNNIDNPFANDGIYTAWDEEYERVIVTKKSSDNNEFSIDYYPSIKAWGFFHSFIPNFMINNRKSLYAIDYNTLSKMNVGDAGKFYTVYNSAQTINTYTSYVDIIFTKASVINKRFKSILWNSIVTTNNGSIDNTKTFDYITIFNKNKHSNMIQLINKTFGSGNVRLTGGLWKFNSFRDVLYTKNIEIVNRNNIDELLLKTLSDNQIFSDWYKHSLFIDDYIIVRFEFGNYNSNSIKVTDIFINSDKMQR